MITIPQKYFWPGLIITLLLSSVVWWVGMLFVARSDGGPQVVENYYGQAANFDELSESRRAAERAGWRLEVDWQATEAGGAEFDLTDKAGEPVTGLEGTVELRRPDLSGVQASSELEPVAGRAGRYSAAVSPNRAGLWDVILQVRRGETVYRLEHREEVFE